MGLGAQHHYRTEHTVRVQSEYVLTFCSEASDRWREYLTRAVPRLDKLQNLVTTDRHALVADEPPDVGDGLGPDPYELLLAALGS